MYSLIVNCDNASIPPNYKFIIRTTNSAKKKKRTEFNKKKYVYSQLIDWIAFVDTSMVIVQFISADFFFFITNINSTFPLSLAWLFRVNTPAPNSLPRPAVLDRAFESTLTMTPTFLVERSPALPLGIVTCPTVTPWYMNVAMVLSNL